MGEQIVVREYQGHEWAWPSIALAIHRPLGRGLRAHQPPDCPLTITTPKRYWRVRWAGVRVGAWPMLEITVTNRSAHAVHSFALRFIARSGDHASGTGRQPEGGLAAAAWFSHTIQEPDGGCVAACVDFVQYASGEVWHARDHECLVTEAGVQAGVRAASIHLQSVLTRSDAAAVMAQLARLHAAVAEPFDHRRSGASGFYSGVTNMAVRVKAAFERDGHEGVETFLRSDRISD